MFILLALNLGIWPILSSVLYMVGYRSPTSFVACGYPAFPVSFAKETVLSPFSVLGTLVKNQLTVCEGLFWALGSVTSIYVSLLTTGHTVLITVTSQWLLKLGSASPPTLSFPKIVLALWGPLHFHMNFRITSLISAKEEVGILVENALNL